jgi:hypothetical protein
VPTTIGGFIVVGVHDSENAQWALRWAGCRAFARQVELRVVTAVVMPAPAVTVVSSGAYFADSEGTLGSVRAWQSAFIERHLDPEPFRPFVSAHVAIGTPVQVLKEVAQGAELLVLGPSRRREFLSISKRCRNSVDCPVVIIDECGPQ